MIEVPEAPPRRTDRKTCPTCEASAAGCRSNAWLRGRLCCDACTGNHDVSTSRERHPAGAVAPADGTEGRERGQHSSPAMAGLRDVDPQTTERKARP